MTGHPRLTRIALSGALTLACLAGALAAGILAVRPAHAEAGCANTECEGVIACRYMKGIVCSFPDKYSCLNTRCGAGDN